jgi:hypothetical protein
VLDDELRVGDGLAVVVGDPRALALRPHEVLELWSQYYKLFRPKLIHKTTPGGSFDFKTTV